MPKYYLINKAEETLVVDGGLMVRNGEKIALDRVKGLTITISSMGYWMLTIRNNMINVLAEDYVTVAKAKGLSLG